MSLEEVLFAKTVLYSEGSKSCLSCMREERVSGEPESNMSKYVPPCGTENTTRSSPNIANKLELKK